ncbi:hypothetical protein GLOTRDRAFT_95283 [Gloeophyllum trabeum ATCC 11539]|uniref:Actin-like ATPase domain-containing protein n=1 Tax=Gloeophyllum trabeum (strain ATCC 11539 / FP-39264 / Madison 617) TaxID=670483 RepID=S7RKV6_GLOTA|nr:uncharacterized protein GLOTRDRAFT_95283 [Gloeophyllum trabeum ATCC 11539]EPQ53309.1 hypothetical protein GLOTRDRAFT_95283 [Gloeophyllum trabeum ATCC 11539]
MPRKREPYKGHQSKLVVAVDIGTTFTAASFCILEPGVVPEFREVLRWKKQKVPDAKVPSVIYYNKQGQVQAFAAETDEEEVIAEAELRDWEKSQWFKLHLRPGYLPVVPGLSVPPLPARKTVVDAITDFLRYVKEEVIESIASSCGVGKASWMRLRSTLRLVLTTPNGWEGKQQHRMRVAAIQAGFVGKDDGNSVQFLSEPEAAVLYAIETGSMDDWLKKDSHLLVCDCGGGTIDVTGYRVKEVEPLWLEETTMPKCYLGGAILVGQAARKFLEQKLKGTVYDNPDAIQRAVENFDNKAKKSFDGTEEYKLVCLPGHTSIPELCITKGRIKINGSDVKYFFKESLDMINLGLMNAYENDDEMADVEFVHLVLVGGLANSPYIYKEVLAWADDHHIDVVRPEGLLSKAVPHGALSWYLDDPIDARITKASYGVEMLNEYDPALHDALRRKPKRDIDGIDYVDKVWDCILPKARYASPEKPGESLTIRVGLARGGGHKRKYCN